MMDMRPACMILLSDEACRMLMLSNSSIACWFDARAGHSQLAEVFAVSSTQ